MTSMFLTVVLVAMFLFSVLALCMMLLSKPEAAEHLLKQIGEFFVNILKELRNFFRFPSGKDCDGDST